MPRIPTNLRERAIGMLNAGMATNEVARVVGCSSRSIRNLRQRFQATGRTEDLPRSGRPRVTTPGQDRYIMNTHLRNRFQTATATAANTPGTHNNRISDQTVRNRLREGGLRAHRPYVGCLLTRRHRVNRVNWARTHIRWIRQQWNSVLFSDESRFSIHRSDGRVRVYRRRNERYADCCLLERDRFGGGGSVLVWAGIAHGYRTPLVVVDGNLNAQRYRDEILARHVIPMFQNIANINLFQQDNATSHTARDTVNFPRTNNIAFINDWPAKSPDLNPIEHLWDNLDQRIRRRRIPPSNINDLTQALIQEWNNIPQAEINTLVGSMRQRCQAVLHAQGGHTRY